MKLYRIANWSEVYEVSDAKKIDGPLKWVATPTKHEGVGFRRIVIQRDRSDLFAIWNLLIQIAAKLPKKLRGMLVASDGTPLDTEALALKTGWPEQAFERALTFFSDPKQGWLTVHLIADQPAPSAAPSSNGGSAPNGSAAVHDEDEPFRPNLENPGKSAEIRGEVRTTGQDITRQGKETSSPPPTSAPPPSEGQRFVVWFVELLEVTGAKPALTPSTKESWADCYEKMIRIDGRTKEQIKEVCRWARDDAFWRKNFLSPMKLREKKEGVMWFDQFLARMSSERTKPRAPAGPSIYTEPEGWRERFRAKHPGLEVPVSWFGMSSSMRNDLLP